MMVLHTITGLHVGGAEAMLANLVEHSADARIRPIVLSMMAPGPVAGRIRASNVSVRTLDMREGAPSLAAAVRLAREARRIRPDLIQGWMHHGNLAATFASWSSPKRPPAIWNVRHSLVDIALEKPLTRAILRLEARLSRGTAAIVYNSRTAARQYEAFGFETERTIVIPNGFDCARWRPQPGARARLEREFGVSPESVVVAQVTRLHPMKDPETLVEAVRRVRERGLDAHLLLVGRGFERPPAGLATRIKTSLPPERVTLAGERHDVAAWLAGVDILTLPSAWGEGFSNILGEALASGVPCVATDVGDSAWIVGEHGRIAAVRNPEAFAAALAELIELGPEGRRRMGEAGRARVVALFSLAESVRQYEALYEQVIRRAGRAA